MGSDGASLGWPVGSSVDPKEFSAGDANLGRYVGNSTSNNTLTVSAGGQVTATGNATIGYASGANYNTVLVTGSGSSFTSGSTLDVGRQGSYNSLTVANGAAAVGYLFYLSGGPGNPSGAANNTVTVTGAGSTLAVSASWDIADRGAGNQFNVLDGGTANMAGGAGYVGWYGGSASTIEVDGAGSTWNTGGVDWGNGTSSHTAIVSNGGTWNTGTITVKNANALNLNSSGALNVNSVNLNTASARLNLDGGTLMARQAGNLVTGSGQVNLLGPSNILTNYTTTTINRTIYGGGSLTKLGSGTLAFTAANTYTGGTTISAGTLVIGGGGTTGWIAGDVIDNANLTFNRSDNIVFGGSISGTGSVTKLGSGTLTLIGANTYTGGTIILGGSAFSLPLDPGVLFWDPDGNAANNVLATGAGLGGSGTWTAAGGNYWYNPFTGQDVAWTDGAPAAFAGTGGTVTISGAVSPGKVSVGSGTFTLQSGTLMLPEATGTTFEIAGATLTVGSTIAGSGGLLKSGSGTLIVTGANTYTGGTTLIGGTLSVDTISDSAANALGTSGAITVYGDDTNTPTFQYTGTEAAATARYNAGGYGSGIVGATVIDVSQSTGSLTLDGGYNNYNQSLSKTGAGTLALSGVNVLGWGSAGVHGGTLVLAAKETNSGLYTTLSDINAIDTGATLKFAPYTDGVYYYQMNQNGDFNFTMTGGTLDLNGDSLGGQQISEPIGYGTITNSSTTAAVLNVGLFGSHSFSGNIQDGAGTVGVVFYGGNSASIWTLSGTNSYSGGTIISGNGTLQLGSDNALPTGQPLQLGDVNRGFGVLDLNGHDLALTGLFTGEASEANNIYWDVVTNSSASPATLTINNTGDYVYEGYFSGNLSIDKYGPGKFTTTGGNLNSGDVSVYDGTLEVLGYFLSCPQTVSGYGNPQLTGKVDPRYGTTNGLIAPNWERVYTYNVKPPYVDLHPVVLETLGTDWHLIVRQSIGGMIHVNQTGKTLIFPTEGLSADNPNNPINLKGSDPNKIIGGYDVGTVAELRAKYGSKFEIYLPNDTRLIVMEDETGVPWNDFDYDDVYWTVDVYKLPDPLPPCGPCQCNLSGFSTPNVSGNNGASSITVGGECNACGAGGDLKYDSRTAENNSGTGYGWYSQATPQRVQTNDGVVIVFDATRSSWFTGPVSGVYTAQYGSKDTLTYDSANHLYRLTEADGTVYTFFDSADSAHPMGSLDRSVAASGATSVVNWSDGKVNYIEQRVSPTASSFQKQVYAYKGVGDANAGRVASVTVQEWNGSAWANFRKEAYDYYVADEPYGLTGDLKTCTVQYATGNGWSAGDVTYMRYYTDSAGGVGFEHGLKRVVLPNAYQALYTATGGVLSKAVEGTPGSGQVAIANYTCFYYEYDSEYRVTKEVVFGQSNSYTLSPSTENAAVGYTDGPNNWKRKTVETRPEGSTYTVYANYLGQPLLTDLCDSSGNHTLTYNRYDNNGRLVLTAEPSAFIISGGVYYSESNLDLVDYNNIGGDHSPYLNDDAGLFYITTYYASTTSTITATNAGGVEGYVHQTAVAEGEDTAHIAIGNAGGPVLLSSYEYFARWDGAATTYAGAITAGASIVYPVASQTAYSDEEGADAVITSYDYAWYTGTGQMKERKTTLPAVSAAQNGPGDTIRATRLEYYDARGNATWSADERGRFTHYVYDYDLNPSAVNAGRLMRTIQDVDAGDGYSLPTFTLTGWPSLPASGQGASQTTDHSYDLSGRLVQTLGPAHDSPLPPGEGQGVRAVRTASWTVYKDADHETRSAQGYVVVSTGAAVIVGPISITITDKDGRVTDRIQATYTDTLANLATATISRTNYVSWTMNVYKNTRLWTTADYFNIPTSTTKNADGFYGTIGTDYNQTAFGYENYNQSGIKGRQVITVDPSGTIQHVFLDARGNVIQVWVGTNDVPTSDYDGLSGINRYDFRHWVGDNPTATTGPAGSNMVKVASSTYGTDGNLLTSTSYADASTSYTTEYQYDWRDRVTDTASPLLSGEGQGEGRVVTHYDLDNLGRTLWTKTYASADFTLDDAELRAETNNLYDSLGRVYESDTYSVAQTDSISPDPDPGTPGHYLPTYTWYDLAGNVIKSETGATGAFQKYSYDGLGRLTVQYTGYDTDEPVEASGAWDAANAVDSTDIILQQTQTWYNAANEAVASAAFQRFPDSTLTGPLSAANSYATASVAWYDGLGRTIATANYGREDVNSGLTHYVFNGTNGADAGGSYSAGDLIDVDRDGIPDVAQDERPETYLENTSSLAGIDFQLQLVEYDSAGRAYRTIDNLGRISETQYDLLGRTVRTIQNYDDGTVEETDTAQDLTTEYQYDSKGRMVTLTAYNAKGSGNGVQQQATKYLYACPFNAGHQTGVVYPDSTDTLSQDSSTKVWSITTDLGDHVSTAYDRLGRTTNTTDQRGVVHTYSFDTAGRLSADTVTSLGSSGIVDDAILRIGTAYDDIGRVQSVTSFSDTSGTTAVNQVAYAYNSWGNLAQESQAHDGAVDPQTTPSIQYTYADGASGGVAKYVRLDHVTYPDGDREVHYNYAAGVDSIMSRLSSISDGSGTLASYKYLGLGQIVEEDYVESQTKLTYLDSSGNITGLDRFGRIVDQLWADDSWNPVDEYKYAYDRASNRTSKDNELHAAFNEDYTYDNLNRLTSTQRADDHDQSWGLDGLGNFGTFTDDSTTQTRTADAANQITGITGGPVTPTYDRAGNMISGPQSGNDTARVHFVYDSWNRLVAVLADDTENPGTPGDVIATYFYDGANRRIEKIVVGTSDVHYFYNANWQLLEERTLTSDPEPLTSVSQYVWSPRYIDALVVRFHDANGDGDLLDAGDNVRYYTNDANFNVTSMIDAVTGDVVNHYVYDAYGKVTVYSSTWTNAAAPLADGPLYCGYFFDAETGNYLARNRYYTVVLATWLTKDPIGYRGGINFYEYVGNSPLMRSDPLGLFEPPTPVDVLATAPEFEREPGATVVHINNLGDLLSKVRGAIDEDSCLSTLEIEGHGYPGGIDLGNDTGRPNTWSFDTGNKVLNATAIGNANANDVGNKLARLPWCCSCTIILNGCNTGNRKGALTWPQVLANKTGCTVRASGGYSSGTVHFGDSKISQWYYVENAYHPGLYEQFGNWWVGLPAPDYRTIRELEETSTTWGQYPSEDSKWYEFTPNRNATGAPSPTQLSPSGAEKCCTGK